MDHETYMELYRKVSQWSGALSVALAALDENENSETWYAAIEALHLVADSIGETLRLLDNTPIPKRGEDNEA